MDGTTAQKALVNRRNGILLTITRRANIGLALTAALGLAGCGGIGGLPQPCEPEARAHLSRLGVASDEITDITVRSDARSGRSSTRITTYAAWTRLKSCDGHLIVEMGRTCQVRRVYFQNSRCSLSGGGPSG